MNNEFEKMNLFSISRDILRNIWVIVLMFVSVKIIVWSVITLSFVPQYTSSATVAVSTGSMSSVSGDLATAESLAQILSEVLDSRLMLDAVEEDLGRNDLNITIGTKLITNTNLLTISVTAQDARTAFESMQSVMRNYDTVIGDVVSDAVLHVIQQPAVAFTSINSPNRNRPSTLAALAAALAAAALIVWFSLQRQTIKRSCMITTQLNAHLLGTLPHEKLNKSLKAKIRKLNKGLLTTNAAVSFAFVERVRQLCARIDHTARRHDCRSILVTSYLENEGKSTVATNIAMGLAQQGKKVLLVDADLRKPAVYKLLGKTTDDKSGLSAWLEYGKRLNDQIYFDKHHNVWVCCGKKHCRNASELLGSERMVEAMVKWRREYDYVILDMPPMSVTSDTEVIAKIADGSILVVREDWAHQEALNECINYLNRTQSHFLGCVFNDEHSFELTRIGTYGSKYGYGYGYGGYEHKKDRDDKSHQA